MKLVKIEIFMPEDQDAEYFCEETLFNLKTIYKGMKVFISRVEQG